MNVSVEKNRNSTSLSFVRWKYRTGCDPAVRICVCCICIKHNQGRCRKRKRHVFVICRFGNKPCHYYCCWFVRLKRQREFCGGKRWFDGRYAIPGKTTKEH